MDECYKLAVTKIRNDGTRRGMTAQYPLRQECLISLEEDFKKYQAETGTLDLHLLRIDQQGVKELRRYVKKQDG